jgi:hypothetical protein
VLTDRTNAPARALYAGAGGTESQGGLSEQIVGYDFDLTR